MAELAAEIIADLPAPWHGSDQFIAGCTDAELMNLLRWLWHWDTLQGRSKPEDPLEALALRECYKDPWRAVKNPVGLIIQQCKSKHLAPLRPEERDSLKAVMDERMGVPEPGT